MDTNVKKGATRVNPWDNLVIRRKIIFIVLMVVIVSVASLTVFNSISITQNTNVLVGEELTLIGRDNVLRAAENIEKRVNELKVLALTPNIIQLVEEANQTNAALSDEEINQIDSDWQAEVAEAEALVSEIKGNEVSDYLRTFMAAFPGEIEVFVTDRYGLNVAMSDRTGDYLQADEGWWQAAYANGQGADFIDKVKYDESTEGYAMNIATPVRDQNGTVIGVLRGTVDVSVIFDTLSQVRIGETGEAILLDANDIILYASDEEMLMQPAPEWLKDFLDSEDVWNAKLQTLAGQPALAAQSELSGELGEALGWEIVMVQETSEISQVTRRNLLYSILLALGVAIVFSLVGMALAISISNPIRMITESVKRLSQGDIRAKTDTQDKKQSTQLLSLRKDEIGEISRAIEELTGYMTEMSNAAGQIADNNLAVQVQPKSQADVLGNAFQRMVSNLQKLIRSVVKNAEGVNSASARLAEVASQAGQATDQISSTIQQVAAGTTRQTESINTTASAVGELDQAIDGVARGASEQALAIQKASVITAEMNTAIGQAIENIKMATDGAGEAAKLAQEGAQRVTETISGMQSIREKVGQVGESIQEMGQRSEQIGNIVETIEDIASQTNLLALNAAIEAARAGEHGKGFAVVADEVSKLAERSSFATKEIAELIENIQVTIKDAIQAMQASGKEVENGVEKAGTAGVSLENILKASQHVFTQSELAANVAGQMMTSSNELVIAVDSVSAVIEENTAATEQMSASANEVTAAIENIASISEENSAATEEVSASTEEVSAQTQEVSNAAAEMRNMAEALREVVASFKLSVDED